MYKTKRYKLRTPSRLAPTRGASLVEYMVILALGIMVSIGVVGIVGNNIGNSYSCINNALGGASSGQCSGGGSGSGTTSTPSGVILEMSASPNTGYQTTPLTLTDYGNNVYWELIVNGTPASNASCTNVTGTSNGCGWDLLPTGINISNFNNSVSSYPVSYNGVDYCTMSSGVCKGVYSFYTSGNNPAGDLTLSSTPPSNPYYDYYGYIDPGSYTAYEYSNSTYALTGLETGPVTINTPASNATGQVTTPINSTPPYPTAPTPGTSPTTPGSSTIPTTTSTGMDVSLTVANANPYDGVYYDYGQNDLMTATATGMPSGDQIVILPYTQSYVPYNNECGTGVSTCSVIVNSKLVGTSTPVDYYAVVLDPSLGTADQVEMSATVPVQWQSLPTINYTISGSSVSGTISVGYIKSGDHLAVSEGSNLTGAAILGACTAGTTSCSFSGTNSGVTIYPVVVDSSGNFIAGGSADNGCAGEAGQVSVSSFCATPVAVNEDGLDSVSCPSTTFCMAFAAYPYYSTYNGSSWSGSTFSAGSIAVSCPSTTFCVAVRGGDAYIYSASSWTGPSQIDSNGGGYPSLNSVSCPSTNFCMAVDNYGYIFTYNGTTWSSGTNISTNALDLVSCSSLSFCVVVAHPDNVLVYNGNTWSSNNIDSGAYISSVSCTSPSFCTAVDASGNALIYNGNTWSSNNIDSGNGGFESVSCTSSSFCMAVDGFGNALIYNGATWSAPVYIDSGTPLLSVSCASSSFCVAGDSYGNAVVYNG